VTQLLPGIEEILDRHADLKVARSIYRASVEKYPGRVIILCDGARVVDRSDRQRRKDISGRTIDTKF
jgi:hypothetical protein